MKAILEAAYKHSQAAADELSALLALPEAGEARAATLRYLREQHASISKRVEHYTTVGHGAPGFVEQLQRDLRGIEAAMQGIAWPASDDRLRALQDAVQYAVNRLDHDPAGPQQQQVSGDLAVALAYSRRGA